MTELWLLEEARDLIWESWSRFWRVKTRPLWDFEDIGDWWTRADADAIAPIVAVPTTAGTGSEVGRASVITNSITEEKKIIFHPKFLPSVVICDPELTVGMPKFITAGTGLDAFAHCVEAFCSPHYLPMSQGMALEGMRLVKTFLPRAYADGSDLEARAHMMSSAAMGATALSKRSGRHSRLIASDRGHVSHASWHNERGLYAWLFCNSIKPLLRKSYPPRQTILTFKAVLMDFAHLWMTLTPRCIFQNR